MTVTADPCPRAWPVQTVGEAHGGRRESISFLLLRSTVIRKLGLFKPELKAGSTSLASSVGPWAQPPPRQKQKQNKTKPELK